MITLLYTTMQTIDHEIVCIVVYSKVLSTLHSILFRFLTILLTFLVDFTNNVLKMTLKSNQPHYFT